MIIPPTNFGIISNCIEREIISLAYSLFIECGKVVYYRMNVVNAISCA